MNDEVKPHASSQLLNNPIQRTICGALTRRGLPCRQKIISANARCRMHGGASRGPYSRNGRAVGVFKRALCQNPALQAMLDEAKATGKTNLRDEAIALQAAWIAQALKTKAISERAYQWLEQALKLATKHQRLPDGTIRRAAVTKGERQLILNRCYGPDLYEMSRANETLFHGIKDASDPWELITRGLITLIFREDDVESIRQAIIDAEVKRMFYPTELNRQESS